MTQTASDPHHWGSQPDFVGPRHEYRESLMLRLLEPHAPEGPVLNAGCGGGSLSIALIDRGYDVTSFDFSREFVEHAKHRISERFRDVDPAPVVEWGDIQNLHYGDSSFSTVVCGEVLEHIRDDARAVAELHRVMTPGGILQVSVPANPHRYDWVDRWAGHERRYTGAQLRSLLEAAGFTDVSVISWGFPLTGLYHRFVYRPMLRRRLSRDPDSGLSGGSAGRAHRMLRRALEFDTLFLGKFPGWFGLIAIARKPAP